MSPVPLTHVLRDVSRSHSKVDEHLFGEGSATLSDHLVGKQRLDPSLDAEAIMREMLRLVLRTQSLP